MSKHNYRLYSFVAGLYLSDLQKGLQTAHVVGDLSQEYYDPETVESIAYATWAAEDKTIVICTAGNHKGVKDCAREIGKLSIELRLPFTIFFEDEESMNQMATAFGVVVPQILYSAVLDDSESTRLIYKEPVLVCTDPVSLVQSSHIVSSPTGQFITMLKSFRLA
jgi:hypothetical protein